MSNIFVQLKGIDGESKDSAHEKWIDAQSATYNVSQATSMEAGGGGGVGKASFGAFTFSHFYDKASPNLFTFCASGKHIEEVVVSVCKSGDGAQEYLKITMKDVMVTSVMPSGAQGTEWLETVSLAYSEIKIDFKEQDQKGKATASVMGGWNVKENKKNV